VDVSIFKPSVLLFSLLVNVRFVSVLGGWKMVGGCLSVLNFEFQILKYGITF